MAIQVLFFTGNPAAQVLTLVGDSDGVNFSLTGLQFRGTGVTYPLAEPIDGLMEWLDVISGTDYSLKPSLPQPVSLHATWIAGATPEFFGRALATTAAIDTDLFIRIPATGGQGTVRLTVCGRIDIGGTIFTAEPFCLRAEFVNGLPRLSALLPDLGLRIPWIELPWRFSDPPALPSSWPAMSFDLPSLGGRISFRAIEIRHDSGANKTILQVRGLMIQVAARSVEADVKLVLQNGDIVLTESQVRFIRPQVTFDFPEYYFDDDCFILHGSADELNSILSFLAPELDAFRLTGNLDWVIRIFHNGDYVEDVRIDLRSAASKVIGMPGFNLTVPAASTLHLVFRKPDGQPQRLWLGLTLAANAQIAVSLPFCWEREVGGDNSRELMPDAAKSLEILGRMRVPTTVVIARFVDGVDRTFFKKTPTPLERLDIQNPLQSCGATTDELNDLVAADFQVDTRNLPDLKLGDTGLDGLKLPFLQDEISAINQVVKLGKLEVQPPHFGSGPDDRYLAATIGITVTVGDNALEFKGRIELRFYWESLAFRVNHDEGIKLKIPNPPVKQELFGLQWTFEPAPGDADFILLTKESNYQIQQVPGSRFILGFDRATRPESPIQFEVSNFSLTPKGISLDAAVMNTPAKLAALDTEFRFTEGAIQIRDNQIAGFTIGGAGALPPALVGPAIASARLQFEQDPTDHAVRLISADARLQGDSLLKCDSTRFQFAVTALGLKFVEEGGRYHLYFTLSGMARFVLAGGDKPDGPLGWLPAVELQMVECPLTTDISVLARHVTFLIALPEPEVFPFLGCFEFELRAIGFAPRDPVFRDPKPAMLLSGQVKFSTEGADAIDARIDFHNLHIGLPAAGSNFPQLYLKGLGIKLAVGSAFEIGGFVDFIDEGTDLGGGVTGEGFKGGGEMQIQGLPRITAGFAFLRVKRNPQDNPVRAWFLYLEASRFSLEMPIIRVFLREIGLGFGYRMTLAMIKSVDEVEDPKQLLKVLKEQAKRQGELSRFEAWRVDLEEPGEDPRWTIALRGMIAQNSAASSPTDWNPEAEEVLPNLFLLDVVAAVRSDLTILMVARAWFLTNYFDFTAERPRNLREQPLLTGFVLLSPRKKRLLANLSSNPNAVFGEHSPVPEIVTLAIRGAKFSATLLVEPGLVHYELGWPNQLRWEADFDVLKLQFCGGMIYRLSKSEFVIGQSFLARGTLQFSAGVDFGFVGARLSATANVAYGARYIGVLAFEETNANSAFYGGAGIEITVAVSVAFWIEIDLLFGSITLDFNFSFGVNFTASVEVGILLNPTLGVRGMATLGLGIMGHDMQFAIRVAFNENAVSDAYDRTQKFLNVGLEAGDVEPIPGVPAGLRSFGLAPGALHDAAPQFIDLSLGQRAAADPGLASTWDGGPPFETPSYRVLMSRVGDLVYFLLVPSGEILDAGRATTRVLQRERGFLPVPPTGASVEDFHLSWVVPPNIAVKQALPANNGAFNIDVGAEFGWTVAWDAEISFNDLDREATHPTGSTPAGTAKQVKLRHWLNLAFHFQKKVPHANNDEIIRNWEEIEPIGDPVIPFTGENEIVDERVHDPAEDAFEAAVRGAVEQFKATPYLKRSDCEYDVTLREAFDHQTSLYADGGDTTGSPNIVGATPEHLKAQQTFQTRSVILRSLIADFQRHVEAVRAGQNPNQFIDVNALACRMGLVFRADLSQIAPTQRDAACVTLVERLNAAGIKQRTSPVANNPTTAAQQIRVFNPPDRTFAARPPKLNNLVHYEHEGTVAIDWILEWRDRQQQALADASLGAGGAVSAIAVDAGSRGYDPLSPPAVTLDPPGATAFVIPGRIDSHGSLLPGAISIRLGGDGYSAFPLPTVTITPPSVGIQATAQVDATKIDGSGRLQQDAIVITNAGSGYDPNDPPVVDIQLPTGRVAATARVNGAKIIEETGEIEHDAVVIINAGAGYTTTPRVRIASPSLRRRSEFDPSHHLDHYVIRRRWLDGNSGDRAFRVKAADVLHRDKDNVLKRLKPRFQFVDHFDDEPAESLAALPPEGKRYAYTIVPIDLTGVASANVQTVIVRRMPATPPPTITESEFIVDYQVPAEGLPVPSSGVAPKLRPVQHLTFRWTPPPEPTVGPRVAVAAVRLVFRPEEVLAIGQYGQDSDAGGPRAKGLAASNARPLRTDRLFEFSLSGPLAIQEMVDPENNVRQFYVELPRYDASTPSDPDRLPDLGDLSPNGASRVWQPISWRVFVQTKSVTNVYSALVPINIRVRFTTSSDSHSPRETAPEERRPGTIEWLPDPVQIDMLPPRDISGQPGFVQSPMPALVPYGHHDWQLGQFELHPLRRRCLRMAWNQVGTPGATVVPQPAGYPREYHSGYDLFEFDADARVADKVNELTTLSASFRSWASQAGLRQAQRFEMLPADMLLTSPSDTSDPQKWEAWYPSTMRRRRIILKPAKRQRGSQAIYSPWFSWRESILVWPDPAGRVAEVGGRQVLQEALHPALKSIIDDLQLRLESPTRKGINAVFGPIPATTGSLNELMAATNAAIDPYGWGVLQRLGLSVSFTLRDGFGDPIPPGDPRSVDSLLHHLLELTAAHGLRKHFHVEVLFQPAKSVRVARDETPRPEEIAANELLSVIQLSLRPYAEQIKKYTHYDDEVPAGTARCEAIITPQTGSTASVVIKGFNADQIIEVGTTGLKMDLGRPMRRTLEILARHDKNILPPTIQLSYKRLDNSEIRAATPTPQPLPVTDNDSAYFTYTAADVDQACTGHDERWVYLQRLIQALNPRELAVNRLTLQLPSSVAADPLLGAEILSWLQRFFDHGSNIDEHAGAGPWLATAYPRALAVTAIAPNPDSGLLEFCHPVEDLYAHAWRYYLRPSGRYDALWASIGQSHVLFRDADGNVNFSVISKNCENLAQFRPPPPGGLDLVLPRIRPLSAPSILFSGRLDAPQSDAAHVQMQPPGKTWQVVLAKHAEQALVEKNRTLARRLAYRQISVALFRQYQYESLLGQSTYWYASRALPTGGPILAVGDVLQLMIGDSTPQSLTLATNDVAGLVSALAAKGVAVETWRKTNADTAVVIRSKANILKLTFTAAGGAPVEWIELNGAAPPFDEYVSIEFPILGPILGAGELLNLFTTSWITLPTVNNVAELIVELRKRLPGAGPSQIAGQNNTLCRLWLQTPFRDLRLEAVSASGSVRRLVATRRPQPRWGTPRPEVPAGFPTITRSDPLVPYEVESVDELRQLDLPARLGRFGQGAIVYQWQCLPFYFQRQLQAVAQATDVVSEISTTTQRDFEYVSPVPRALMDGLARPSGERFRRIRIRLENLWSCLTTQTQLHWPLETPESYSPDEPRPYSAAVDPVVIYQLVVRRPGGVIQQLSQVFSNTLLASGYEVRNFPCQVDGVQFKTEIVRRLPWGNDATRLHEEYLETNLTPGSDNPVLRAVSSRHLFDSTKFTPQTTGTAHLVTPADVDVFPRSSTLALTNRLVPTEITALDRLLLGVPRDIAFKLKATRFLERVREFHSQSASNAVPDICEEVSVGLDQLSELADDPSLVVIDIAMRRVTWASNSTNTFTADQKRILEGDSTHFGWRQSSAAGATLTALLAASPSTNISLSFTAGETVPTIGTGHVLDGRLTIFTTGISRVEWTLGALTAAELAALQGFANAASGLGTTFRAAIARILTMSALRVVQVVIQEGDFAPRPSFRDFEAAGLGAKAGHLRGAMQFTGIMLRNEERAIEDARLLENNSPLVAVDGTVIRQLHNDALRSGFAGGELVIVAVRGSAPSKSEPIKPYLQI